MVSPFRSLSLSLALVFFFRRRAVNGPLNAQERPANVTQPAALQLRLCRLKQSSATDFITARLCGSGGDVRKETHELLVFIFFCS